VVRFRQECVAQIDGVDASEDTSSLERMVWTVKMIETHRVYFVSATLDLPL
jgi:hypothetical protein